MEGQEYLNQITESSKPVKKIGEKKSFFSSRFMIVGAIGLAALLLIIILGSLLGGEKGGEKNLGTALILHIKNTSEEVQKYQPDVKSSELRSYSATLNGVLGDFEGRLTEYMVEKYGYKENKVDKKFLEEADAAKEELDSELFEAKINGILDRIFAHKMAYEITLIKNEELKFKNATKSDLLKSEIDTSVSSLDEVYENFNNYSEAK